ncbi:MAG TPA: hypothetical protein VGI84_05435 [Pseudonocardiaceae bacterium]
MVLLKTDKPYAGAEPSGLFGKAITSVITPDNVFELGAGTSASAASSSASPSSPEPSSPPPTR